MTLNLPMQPLEQALPSLLVGETEKVVELFRQRHGIELSATELKVISVSPFVGQQLLRHPRWLESLRLSPPLADEHERYATLLAQQLAPLTDENQLMNVLRLFKHEMSVRIAWAQALNLIPTERLLLQLSQLAEALIDKARLWLYAQACETFGQPQNSHGAEQTLLILAMGKLGGRELNFSSDIDLIFVYPENGMTQGGRKQLDNAQFFTRLGQRLIRVLDQVTIEGFVYRVDMRLRPFGESGPLVMSFAAFENYYQEQGRDWERYAMVKARVLGCHGQPYERELQQMLRPFVYRRYIDFSVIQSLRNMKGMIAREVRRRGLVNNIKLGAGGIREIEFIVQVFQLIRGGREPTLQSRSLLEALERIREQDLLSSEQVDLLHESYLFLRRIENVLQAIDNKQTQTLPESAINQSRLTYAMGFATWTDLLTYTQSVMTAVRAIFNESIGEGIDDDQDETCQRYRSIWQDSLSESELRHLVPELSEQEAQALLHNLSAFKQDTEKRTIGHRGRDVLDELMPMVLSAIFKQRANRLAPDIESTSSRVLHLILSIVSRTTYLELLLESPSALLQLVRLCSASTMVASQLARYPILLDELLDSKSLYQTTELNEYHRELRQYLLRIEDNDEEEQLEALRQFKQAQLLKIAAADINGDLNVMVVSDHLTFLSQAITTEVIRLAWEHMVRRYGIPSHLLEREDKGLAVIGYGKLGGLELGYGSDLDLVFLIDCPVNIVTTGPKAMDGRQFYARLTQRIMHLFSTRMASGVLYDVDTRLRPSGDSGLLVSPLTAFADYQEKDAWSWEHQALVRARAIYGNDTIRAAFADIRHHVLTQPREQVKLQQEVREMRTKIITHFSSRSSELFDLKSDLGGIIDIEFIAQYLVLSHAHRFPQLTRWSDNVRIYRTLIACGIMEEAQAEALIAIYLAMRGQIHHLALQERESRVPAHLFKNERAFVQLCWREWLGEDELTTEN